MIEVDLFNTRGQPISLHEWVGIFQRSKGLTSFVGGYIIMTRWIGVDLPDLDKVIKDRWYTEYKWEPNDPPLVFRSVVLDADDQVVESDRYTTKDEAAAGHDRLVAKYKEMYDEF